MHCAEVSPLCQTQASGSIYMAFWKMQKCGNRKQISGLGLGESPPRVGKTTLLNLVLLWLPSCLLPVPAEQLQSSRLYFPNSTIGVPGPHPRELVLIIWFVVSPSLKCKYGEGRNSCYSVHCCVLGDENTPGTEKAHNQCSLSNYDITSTFLFSPTPLQQGPAGPAPPLPTTSLLLHTSVQRQLCEA